MEDLSSIFERFWTNIISRPAGPLALRFYLQPLMAMIFALRDGVRDAKGSRPAYLFAILTHPAERMNLVREGWKSTRKIFGISIVLDVIYQLIVLRSFYPGETLIVATALALLPYALMRGPINRIASVRIRHRQKDKREDVSRAA